MLIKTMEASRIIPKAWSRSRIRRAGSAARGLLAWSGMAGLLALTVMGSRSRGAEDDAAARFQRDIQPILADHCYGCHGNGIKKGGVTLDEFASDDALLQNRDLWWSVLKNVRAGIMPPAKKPRLSQDELGLLADWIKRGAFGIDPQDPDPGRVTIRRLNRLEYRNTIRDLMGIEFKAEEEFPPDDTGYGFDNIGDVLSVSPLLLEKYMQAAETIVSLAVPTVSQVIDLKTFSGAEFRGPEGAGKGDLMTFYKEAKVSRAVTADQEGTHRLSLDLVVKGEFNFDPGRCKLVFRVDDRELLREEFGWNDGKKFHFEFMEKWQPGEHQLAFELLPLTPAEQKRTSVDMKIISVKVEGPLEKEHWVRPKNFERFFFQDDPGTGAGRLQYAREVLRRFTTKAYRRPCDDRTLDRLVALAEDFYQQPGKSVQEGIAQAMVAVLSSPRFLFRVEDADTAGSAQVHAFVDEYALASRLSYFLWSTMPDQELLDLAERGELRKNLGPQVKRMMEEPRSEMLVQNFTGQWLQARDVEGISIDARTVLARDDGEEKELKREIEEFQARLAKQAQQKQAAQAKPDPAAQDQAKPDSTALAQAKTGPADPAKPATPPRRPRFFRRPRAELDDPLRRAMRQETEMYFAAIVHEERNVLDLLDSDFTFVNEKLAKHYGLPDVKGDEMRRVTLPKDSPRGGLLTQGTVLVVTSNPTRTSPVKRGLFLLDNILGTPTPPPPADIPQLEDAEKGFGDREPSLREVLEVHRSKPLCNSCHSRMDPLGLALENFNAMGMWREKERGQALDTEGVLITGEKFGGIRDLKRILKDEHRADFYRCLTEKLLTYALGRGLEYSDVETVDQIVERLEREQGRFSALLTGVIESAPFQKRRNVTAVAAAAAGRPEPGDSTPPQP
jgi:mono/diheme cytochrome c family protein